MQQVKEVKFKLFKFSLRALFISVFFKDSVNKIYIHSC